MNKEEWMESFSSFLGSKQDIHTIHFDLDIITDPNLLAWATFYVQLLYGDNVEICYFRSSRGEKP